MKYTTHQDIFDDAAAYLSTQKERCMSPDNKSCLYFGAEGNMCVIGSMIPEEMKAEVQRGYNGAAITELIDSRVVDGLFSEDISRVFLTDLQAVHDAGNQYIAVEGATEYINDRRDGMRRDMILLAKEYDLDITEVLEGMGYGKGY